MSAEALAVAGGPDVALEQAEENRVGGGRTPSPWLPVALLLVFGGAGAAWLWWRRRLNSFVLVPSQHRRLKDARPGGRRDGGVPWR